MNPIAYIREQRNEYESTPIPLMEGDEYQQYELIRRVNFYWRNKYLENAHDDVIGEYPFDNVSKYRVLLEARATDFDTKHMEVEPASPSRESRVKNMLASKAIKRWMRKYNFPQTLNDICITRPKYGGVLVKRTSDGVHVVPWENVITDQSDIENGVIIERHYYTPAQLKEQKGWDHLDEAIRTAAERRKQDMSNGEEVKTQGHLIEVYELHGVIPVAMLKAAKGEDFDEDDEFEFTNAMIVGVGIDWNKKDEQGDDEENGLILYAEEETESPYKYLARNPIAGRGLGEGVVEALFEHQKWHNFTKTEEMRMLAIAGKKLYWTDDPDILTNIFTDGVDHGTVLRVTEGRTLQELNQIPTGTPVYQVIRQEWDESADKTTSSFASKIGEENKSGTPFRAQYLQNVEASSQFEQYREEIGIFLTEIIEDWILPDAIKELAKEDAIYDSFTPQELQLIDEVLSNKKINNEVLERTLNGEVLTPETMMEIESDVMRDIRKQGKKRYITQIKKFLEDIDGKVVVHTTDEARNKAVYFESLANAIQLVAPEDPRRNAIIDRIMEAIGISKEELELYAEQSIPSPLNPQLEAEQLQQENQVGAVLPVTQ